MPSADTETRVIILNPVSGDADHADAVRKRAALQGDEVWETEGEGDAIELAREAAEDGASLVAAAGGDGTLNEVVRGVVQADALEQVTVGVIPVGTGNNFAQNIGISTIDEGFHALENGDCRRIDLGFADDHPFVNSCVGGLTANASGETSAEMKSKFGVLAYVVTTIRSAATFEGLPLSISANVDGGRNTNWSGDALLVLVGNGRRFMPHGGGQANMEDGLFEVTIIEDAPASDLMGDAVMEELLGREAAHATRMVASELEIKSRTGDPMNYSLDGEMIQAQTLSLNVRSGVLRILVGDGYEPIPEAEFPSESEAP